MVAFGLASGFSAQAQTTVTERAAAVADEAKAKVQEAGQTAVSKIEELWKRIDENRLKNRSRDEILAWVIMGVLVGGVASLFSVYRNTLWQRLQWVLIGLAGAFIAGMISRVMQLDFGIGPVLIRYEDLIISLAGGLILIAAFSFWAARRRKDV
jgi:uncharacterized membrane protein YeaQ/YmgE (transglycosylase-associated protein family)